MLKKFAAFFIVMFSTIYPNKNELPEMIDFGKFFRHEVHYYDHPDTWTWLLGNVDYELVLTAFNGAPELGAFFAFLKETYQIDIAIETGTLNGDTTKFLATCFNEVHTIEIAENLNNRVKKIFYNRPHVHCHLGSSENILSEILPSLKSKTIVFYLDAHWGKYWPLLDEIEAISKTHKDNCVIIIDDIKVPNRKDLGYDAYTINGINYECSYDYVKKQLDKLFTDYSVHYLIPEKTASRAKLVAIPKKLSAKR